MIDPIVEKHNHEEQEKVRDCEAMSEAEKIQMIDMLDSTLDGTNGYITDEKVKRLAINTDKLALMFSHLFRRTTESGKKYEDDMESLRGEVRDMAEDVKAIRKDSQENDESLGKSLDSLRDDIKTTLSDIKKTVSELRDKELLREGAEVIPSEQQTLQSKLMDWVSKNQFWLLVVFLIIAVQGGNLADWLLKIFGK